MLASSIGKARKRFLTTKQVLAACFGAHFILIILASLRATFSIFAQPATVFPLSLRNVEDLLFERGKIIAQRINLTQRNAIEFDRIARFVIPVAERNDQPVG